MIKKNVNIFSSSTRSFSISEPPLPTMMPGRAQWMMILTCLLFRSISIWGTPAAYSFFFRNFLML